MCKLKIVFSLLLVMVTLLFGFSPTLADPLLIQLSLKNSPDWSSAKSLSLTAYHRWDNSVLVELDRTKLVELDRLGLEYRIVDENPWSEEYFAVSSRAGVTKQSLELYGKIIYDDPSWKLMKSSKESISALRGFGYDVVPIHHQPIPLEYKPLGALIPPSIKYSPGIDSLLNLISADSLYVWDLRLQNFKTRYSYIDSIYKARDWLRQKFLSFGIDSLWLHYYNYDSPQYNVVAVVPGTVQPDKVIVVGGHYDSVVYGSGTNPYVWAPGADDNGSGTVATLEMARIIAQHPLPVTVMFVPFAQEEQGLIGSYFFAYYLLNLGTDVRLMINTDMIGHSVDNDTDVVILGDPSAETYINVMMDMANTYTYLRPHYDGQSSGSDHYPFYLLGYDAVYAEEGEFHYAGWHTNYDVVDSLDFDYMKEVVKMCLATLHLVANSPSPVENLQALNGRDGHTAYLSWSANPISENVDHYNIYFGTSSGNYDSLHQTSAVCDTLYNLTENTTYYITVSAVNTGGFESPASPEVSLEVFPVTMDQGILVVDETYDLTQSYNFVNGDSINAFYNRALQDYPYTYSNHSCPNCSPQNQLHMKELGRYSAVILHSEDNRGIRSMGADDDSSYLVLREYMNYGGKVIIEGRRNLSRGNDGEATIRVFSPGEIPYDYLKVGKAYIPPWSPGNRTEEFVGAFSQIPDYPDLQVDSLRVEQCAGGINPPLVGKVPGVGYIDSLRGGDVIYEFHSANGGSASEGKPTAFRYLGSDYQVIYFDFPLYFIQEPEATELLHQALSDLGISTFKCGDCNNDAVVDVGDVVYVINYLFKNGPPPQPMQAGDVNQDTVVDVGDVVYLINYLFKNGSAPCR